MEKHNEALLLLPKIFLDHDFEVFITDPPYANYSSIPDLSIFTEYPQINANNIHFGELTNQWLLDRDMGILPVNLVNHIKFTMIRFSIFKFAPTIFRGLIYDNGTWLAKVLGETIFTITLDNYAALDMLSEITSIDETELDCYNVITNDLTHDPFFLQAPDYVPVNRVTNMGEGPFANEDHYHANIASLILLGKWFNFLKENNVYDNTRIIIASDHGRDLYSNFPDNIILPNNKSLQSYAALLLVKDFNSNDFLSVNDSFMTVADIPLLALDGIVENPVNPWTGKILLSDKENGITLTTSELWDHKKQSKYSLNIKPNEWLHVRENIFEIRNWTSVNNRN